MSGNFICTAERDLGAAYPKMMAVRDACKDAGIEPPNEVIEFFNDLDIGDGDVFGESQHFYSEIKSEEVFDEGRMGLRVQVASIPKDVDTIVFWYYE